MQFKIGNNSFLIRILDLEKFDSIKIKALVGLCEKVFRKVNASKMKIIINISPIDEDFNDYVFFVKLSEGTAIYGATMSFKDQIFTNLKRLLIDLVVKINKTVEELGLEEFDLENDVSESDSIPNPIPPNTNINDLLDEIKFDIKRRKKKDE